MMEINKHREAERGKQRLSMTEMSGCRMSGRTPLIPPHLAWRPTLK
jgi:hypothetical protein